METVSTVPPMAKMGDVVDEAIKQEHRLKADGDLAEDVRKAMLDKKRMTLLGEGVFGMVYRVEGPITLNKEDRNYTDLENASPNSSQNSSQNGSQNGKIRKPSSEAREVNVTYGSVAVKVCKKEPNAQKHEINAALTDYYNELAILRTLDHANILTILLVSKHTHPKAWRSSRKGRELWQLAATRVVEQSMPIIITELCDLSLLDVLHQAPALPLWRRFEFAVDFARGLEYLHSQEIVHRDLKPANLLINGCFIDNDYGNKNGSGLPLYTSYKTRKKAKKDISKYFGRLQIGDFGLAKPLTKSPKAKIATYKRSKSQLNREDSSVHGSYMSFDVGSYRFMAPEIFRHERIRIKTAVDIYSYGMILFWLHEGTPPLGHLSAEEAIELIALQKMRPACTSRSPASDGIIKIIKACWEENPSNRPSAFQLVEMLLEVLDNPKNCIARPEAAVIAGNEALAKWRQIAELDKDRQVPAPNEMDCMGCQIQ